MFKKLLIVFIYYLHCFTFAQSIQNENSILIYSDENGYMQPFIENTIKNLINIETDTLYFNSVQSFNRFITDNKYQAELNDLTLIQKPNSVRLNLHYSENEKKIKERIFNILKSYNYFLTVKSNTLGELIEFQFQLFETESSQNSIYNISDKVLSVENFFINPKEKDYIIQITNAIQRLFKNSNEIPEAELKIYNNIYKSDKKNEIILPINTKILLDGTASGDRDSEKINYNWRNILSKDQKYQTVKKIEFKDNLPLQEIIINDAGKYKIGFKVFDGIEYSKEIIIDINVQEKPKNVMLLNTITYSKNFKSIISRGSKQVFYGKLFIDEMHSDSILNRVVLIKKAISQRTIKAIEEDLIVKPLKIKKENIFSNSYIEFASSFAHLDLSEEKTYYLYNVDKNGLLYDEMIINHIYLSRSIVNFRSKYNYGLIDFEDDDVPGGFGTNYFSLAAGIFITQNIELELAIPIANRQKVNYNGYIFRYPYDYELSINYLFPTSEMQHIGDIIPLFGLNYQNFSINSENVENKNLQASSFGVKFGADYEIKSWNLFDLIMRLSINYNIFSSSTFKKVKSVTFGIGTIFRI